MKNIDEILNLVIEDCLKQHEGGSKFFDNLDEKIREINIVETLVSKIKEKCIFVVSGKFGRYFYDKYKNIYSVLVFNGGLRDKDSTPTVFDGFEYYFDIKDSKVIFIDDSFYSGKTRNKINDFLKNFNSEITHSYVVYDGSKVKQDNVTSLYRYYK